MNSFLILIVFCSFLIAPSDGFTSVQMYINKYPQDTKLSANRLVHTVRDFKMEVTETMGMTEEMIRVAETAIADYYTGTLGKGGKETDQISSVMEKYYGGIWDAIIVKDYSMFAYTIFRRSKSWAVIAVDEIGIVVAREGGTR